MRKELSIENPPSAGSLPTGINAANIADGSVSNTEFQYLDGVTSAIQTQLDGKQAGIQYKDEGSDLGTSGTATSVDFVGAGVTASRASNAVTVTIPSSGITNGAGANVIPKSDGTNIVASKITDDGTDVKVSPIAAGSFIIQQASTPTDDALKVFAPNGTDLLFRVSKEGWAYIGDASTSTDRQMQIRQAGSNNASGLYAGSVTPGDTNYGLFLASSLTIVNTPVTLELRVANAGIVAIDSTGITSHKYGKTVTAGGTTGAQTINKLAGTVNFAAAATTLVVTNSLVTTSSVVFAVIRTNDSTATIKNVVCAAGSFTITLTAAATAETSVGFFVIN